MTNAQTSFLEEIIVDNFAGGGGASTGIELATGRPVTIAVNHDPDAIRMHMANHPYTEHYQASVWDIDPRVVCRSRPVGLAWFSPDCKHFSKAKGGKPVDKNIRGLAWITLRWAGTVRPRVIILENVEEFQTWGPVRRGKPIKSRQGETFQKFIKQLRGLGYAVQWRELVAADYGAPTIRKRFFLIARCDGRPIVWPEPTHGPRDSEDVRTGKKLPWRSAAEIIDWSLPCPSIFDTKEQIKAKYGLSAQRPLRDNTLRRAARGMDKFVLQEAKPFLVTIGYGEREGQRPRVQDIMGPLGTSVSTGKQAVTEPVLVPWTVTNTTNSTGHSADDPTGTAKTGGGCGQMLIAPALIQYHQERADYVRGQAVDKPLCIVDAANRYGVAAAYLDKYYGNGSGADLRSPMPTATAKDRMSLAVPYMELYHNGGYTGRGNTPMDPLNTVTATGGLSINMAYLNKVKCPDTGLAAGTTLHVVKTVVRVAGERDLHHWPEVRQLLNTYCGYHLADDEILLLGIGGAWYYISDIGLRMLTPRELYAANGFPPDYIIERDAQGRVYSKSAQVARCGNAVPPPFATALVRANLPEYCTQTIVTMADLMRAVAM